MNRLEGKTALVTGASRGIGRAIALRLAREGALTVVHYGKRREEAERVVEQIGREGGRALAVGADLATVGGIRGMFEQLDRDLGADTGSVRFDILVNNAGMGLIQAMQETTEASFDQVMSLNARSPFFVAQHAVPRLNDGGRVINLSSFVTKAASPSVFAYSMSKGAVDTFTLALAKELAPRGITVNAIQPGVIDTEMNAVMLQDTGGRAYAAGLSAFGRWGEPEDVADIAAFLASSDSRWVTGQLLDASGGSAL
ncbi:SDR family oxidoreductase [Paenibacillus albicereus]|uniref:SDR family oxidoreductase n=1 Tax=Paenibacillus albicereus TaxID=2726185 RepID=A0A6H2H384_9BACL|nr:SDR family oxidoreductase [Paenibacillus albicereus]QJC54140.1 SDR family oxidoreductase [Paenibacillus albicereus]